MGEGENKCLCFICGQEHSMGPHRYDGKWIPYYRIQVCMNCYNGNHDGWNLIDEAKILARITELGIEEPERNDKGFLPLNG